MDWMTPPAPAGAEWAALGYPLQREFLKISLQIGITGTTLKFNRC